MIPYKYIRPLLFTLSPEMAHGLALRALKLGLFSNSVSLPASLATRVFGMDFPSPVGLAAGFDKNAEALDALLGTGFGFIEEGTCTPRPQLGNPRPRIFRLGEDKAVINRLGFPSCGKEVFIANLKKRTHRGIMGVNIVKNRDSADAVADYVTLLEALAPYADYIAINVSSPNTKGLRDLQGKQALFALLSALIEKRAVMQSRIPLLLKIAPDLSEAEQEAIAEVALAKHIDGLIVSNTSVSRPESLRNRNKAEQGGLSGRPLFAPSTKVLRNMYRLTEGKIPLIGVGGIASGEDAYGKIRAGATLVQLYTGLVYHGFGLISQIHAELARLLERDGFKGVAEAVGTEPHP